MSTHLTTQELDGNRIEWVRPRLVRSSFYAEWTEDEQLRQTTFLGWRDDKCAKDVVLTSGEGGTLRRRHRALSKA